MMKQTSRFFFFFLIISSQTSLPFAEERDYRFDGAISREVLCNYLSRSTTFAELLNSEDTEKNYGGNVEDNVRMISRIGVKFAGRAIYMWGAESRLESLIVQGKIVAEKVHRADPDVVLQCAIFEIVTTDVNRISVPDWVFQEFDLPSSRRNFQYESMLYPEDHRVDQWGKGQSVPDMSQLETRMWFFYLAARYIDIGVEGIHFGQVEIMDDRDPDHRHWDDMMTRVRRYATTHARRRWILCDAHVPSGGIVLPDGKLLFDFHSFPLRIEAVPNKPEQGILRVGFSDSIFLRSKGGLSPSGWKCDALPYLVELDNFGGSGHEGEDRGDIWCWGYDEITWFARQPENYRDLWLRYAWNWIRRTDPNGYLQMPAGRVLYQPVDGKSWYWANKPGSAVPWGFNQEDAIKTIWGNDSN